ncbi:acyltransferase family protein [Chitinimonas sp. PSY-7]|uniref:acyltransferase family protein n=1 Tax=Chitinimonas sp. PSY-7 TaxID=3459088 RepID=UPI004040371C
MTSVTDPIARTEKQRFVILDLLRFAAALAVTLFHFGFRGWIEDASGHIVFPYVAPIAKYGYLGVDAFFLISGFVILLTALNRSPSGFVASRITRLYPAYWLCVCAAFTGFYLMESRNDGHAWLTLLANLTMFQEFLGAEHIDGIYWTLAVELRFYLLIFIVLLLGQMRRIEYFLWLWLGGLLLIDLHVVSSPQWLDEALLRPWAHYFIAGAAFYLVWLHGLRWHRWLLLGLCALRAVQHAYWYMLLKVKLTAVPMDRWVVCAVVLALFALFMAIALRKLPAIKLGRLASVGALTYPLYLVHELLGKLLLFGKLDERFASLQLITVTALAVLCAWAIHRGVERPLAGWLNKKLQPRVSPIQSQTLEARSELP